MSSTGTVIAHEENAAAPRPISVSSRTWLRCREVNGEGRGGADNAMGPEVNEANRRGADIRGIRSPPPALSREPRPCSGQQLIVVAKHRGLPKQTPVPNGERRRRGLGSGGAAVSHWAHVIARSYDGLRSSPSATIAKHPHGEAISHLARVILKAKHKGLPK